MNKIVTKQIGNHSVQAYVEGNEDVFELGDNESIAISKLLLRLQGYPSRTWNGAYALACFVWASLLVESWLMLTNHLAVDWLAWLMWGMFFLIGTFSSAYATRK